MKTKRLRQVFSIIASVLICVGTAFSQGTGTGRPKVVPPSDPVGLVYELKQLLDKHARPGMTDEELRNALNGKSFLLTSTTTDSVFAVSPKLTRYISGIDSARSGVRFRGHIYRLVPENEFPEPEPGNRGMGSGVGTGLPQVVAREELITPFPAGAPAEVWARSALRLKTVVEPTGTRSPADSIRTPQVHYELAFTRAQPMPFVTANDLVFSLQAYEHTVISGPGIVAWLPDELTGSSTRIGVVLMIKLVLPFLKTETLTTTDPVSRKPHVATRHRIYADIVGVWLLDENDGTVVSKDTFDPEIMNVAPVSTAVAPKVDLSSAPNRPLKICSKPPGKYTQLARANQTMGKVTLKVTFLATGQIGTVTVVSGLPDGLTEQAVAAARLIRFDPEMRGGKPVSVSKLIEYSFIIY